jgi:hypothetical protein
MPESPPDDPTIPDDEFLYRRIFPDPQNLKRLPDGRSFRPTTGALRSQEALSVDLGSVSTPEETRDRDNSRPFHVAAISVLVARKEGCRIVRDPEERNPAHALLYGTHEDGSGSLSSGQAKRVARQSIIVLLNAAAPLPDNGV